VNLGLFAVTIAKVGPAKYANLVFPKPDKDALHRRKKRGLHLAFSYLLLAAVGFTAVVGLLFGFASAKQAESAGNLSPASSTSSSPP
jgi:hypothetical protein